jgi:hypothetical protein
LTFAKPPASGRTGAGGPAATALLAIAVLITAAFFFSFWGRNAAGVGRDDMGMALALSFAVPLTFYASLVCAVAALVGAALSWKAGRPHARWLAALAISLLPGACLLLVDLL